MFKLQYATIKNNPLDSVQPSALLCYSLSETVCTVLQIIIQQNSTKLRNQAKINKLPDW